VRERNVLVKEPDRKALIIFVVAVVVGALVAIAGSQRGATMSGFPLFALGVTAAFLIQWLAFIPAFKAQTEKYYDLTGALTYISITLLLVLLTPGVDARGLLLAALVLVWAARLGTFLFRRVSKHGKDDRFDEIKPSFIRFLNTWTVQGLWVVLTAAAAWIAITSATRAALDGWALAGFLLWAVGFGIEALADSQKRRFKADPANEGMFISTGLWSRSRHPNYFGEIMLWTGVLLIAVPVLEGWQWVALLSPVFVALLLIKGSGVPLLEAKADKKWGGQPGYEAYKKNTPVLIPKLK
jgi:steroid 5-alpha reductase family enzyme